MNRNTLTAKVQLPVVTVVFVSTFFCKGLGRKKDHAEDPQKGILDFRFGIGMDKKGEHSLGAMPRERLPDICGAEHSSMEHQGAGSRSKVFSVTDSIFPRE